MLPIFLSINIYGSAVPKDAIRQPAPPISSLSAPTKSKSAAKSVPKLDETVKSEKGTKLQDTKGKGAL